MCKGNVKPPLDLNLIYLLLASTYFTGATCWRRLYLILMYIPWSVSSCIMYVGGSVKSTLDFSLIYIFFWHLFSYERHVKIANVRKLHQGEWEERGWREFTFFLCIALGMSPLTVKKTMYITFNNDILRHYERGEGGCLVFRFTNVSMHH